MLCKVAKVRRQAYRVRESSKHKSALNSSIIMEIELECLHISTLSYSMSHCSGIMLLYIPSSTPCMQTITHT